LEQIQVQERVNPNSSTPTDYTTSTTDLEKKAAQKIVLALLGIVFILFSGSFIINNSFSK
jgi:predicted Co/Zn/Cd cation transporter (cation efflux family)